MGLYPLHATQCEIKRRSKSQTIAQNFEVVVGDFERNCQTGGLLKTTYREYFSAHFPDIGGDPLDEMRDDAEGDTEIVEIIATQACYPTYVICRSFDLI